MWPVLVAPVVLQGIAMAIDELWFHRRRRLPRWERIGHPLDTLTVVACYAWLLLVPCSPRAAAGYAALALLSCAFVTKDESVHARVCTSGEHHVHAVLFLLHPVVLASMALLWAAQRPGDAARGWLGDAGSARVALVVCAAATAAFGAAQAVYWNRPRSAPGEAARPAEPVAPAKPAVDNAFYGALGDGWYTARDHPIALLRAETRARHPWIIERIERRLGGRRSAILDVGCGGGFAANALAREGHEVTGVDCSAEALAVAAAHDATGAVRYRRADAAALPFDDGAFDVVCAMDLLEHVDRPDRVVAEAARVLRQGGLFFFHTFDRNALSWLVVIKGVEWFVRNTPPRMHTLDHFIRPAELCAMCRQAGLRVDEVRGLEPRVVGRGFWRMLLTGVVGDDFAFRMVRRPRTGYTGLATKAPS